MYVALIFLFVRLVCLVRRDHTHRKEGDLWTCRPIAAHAYHLAPARQQAHRRARHVCLSHAPRDASPPRGAVAAAAEARQSAARRDAACGRGTGDASRQA